VGIGLLILMFLPLSEPISPSILLKLAIYLIISLSSLLFILGDFTPFFLPTS